MATNSNDVSIKYVPEVTLGVTPVNDAGWKYTRQTGEALSVTRNREDSQEIRDDREITSSRKTSSTAGGTINFEFSVDTFDDLIEAAMAGTWTAGVLEGGKVKRSFSIEKSWGGDVNAHQLFTGMRVSQFDLNLASGSIMNGTFTFMGNGESRSVTSAVGAGSVAAAPVNDVLNSTSDVGQVLINGASTGFCLTSLNISVNNNMRENNCIGNEFAFDNEWGSRSTTGSFEAFMTPQTWALLDSVDDTTDVSLEFPFTDGTTTYTVELPRVKIDSDSFQAGSKDSDVLVTFNYTALLDAVEGVSIRITKA